MTAAHPSLPEATTGTAATPVDTRTLATRTAISRLLQPRSVAIVGASADLAKTSGRPVAYLQKHGFKGDIYPVNPRVAEIAGLRCHPSVADLPATPDVGLVLLGPERAHQAVRDLAARGTAAAIVLAGGYTETGEEGALRQQQLKEAAGTMRLLGPNTIGLVNLTDGITLSASGALEIEDLPRGPIAVVSQSGGILGALLSRAAARGIGFSRLISTSNEVDLDIADFVDWLVDDDATQVIALYLESLRDPARFRAAALRAQAAGKPIVVFKVGRSDAGARAAVSHTGAMAGADRMYGALFAATGVIRAETFADLLDLPAALASRRPLTGRRIAILTSTGGAGTLVADSLGLAGFDTPAPDGQTADLLRALQQGDQAALDRNPIDVTLAGLQPDLLRGAISTLLGSPCYDAVVVIVGSSALAMPDLMAGALRDCLPTSAKPLLAYVSPHAPQVAALLNRGGIPAFSAPESCTEALKALATLPGGIDRAEAPAAGGAVDQSPSTTSIPSGSLNEAEAKQLFAAFGIPGTRETIVATPDEASRAAQSIGGPLVLKMLSSTVTHKSDIGGVAVNVAAADIAHRMAAMAAQVTANTGAAPEAYLVQEMVSGGVEMILGLVRDPLGTAVLLGMGGVTAELFQDTALRMLSPGSGLSACEAMAMVKSLRTWPLLDGHRGRPMADVDALVDAVVAFSRMAAALGDRLLEAEINPLFVLARGQGVRAADGVALLG